MMSIYDYKDYTGRKLLNENLNGLIIYASCFSQEVPDTHIFPEDMTGVTFLRCNLDNTYIPPGNTVTLCSQRKFKAQNDLCDWLLNLDSTPKEPLEKEEFQKWGISINPADIPVSPLSENIIHIRMREKAFGLDSFQPDTFL